MPKPRDLKFEECLALMRKRDPQLAEDGFHYLLPRVRAHLPELMQIFQTEESHAVRCWILELIGEARSMDAFPLLCKEAVSEDESFQNWGIIGLKLLDTKDARRFLFQNDLDR